MAKETNIPFEALVVHKFNLRNSNDKRAIVLQLTSGEREFYFALTSDAARNLCAGLDKAVIQLQEFLSSSTH